MNLNRKLLVSLTGTLHALQSGRVTIADLASGLFVFGCTREHAVTPGVNGEHIEEIITRCSELHAQLIAALYKAEAENRVRWRTKESRTSFEMVDDLLTAHGYKPLKPSQETTYCYPAVQRLSTQLEVIWRG